MQIVRPVVSTVGGAGGRFRDLARLQAVSRILIRHGLGILVAGIDLPGLPKAEATLTTTPERTVKAIEELGPTYIKLGQVLSTRPDVLPAAYITAFEQLQDDVTQLPFEDIRAVLDKSLGDDWRDRIDIDETPLATASIAQVHRGTLNDGTQVVLKVQRPGISKTIRADLNLLHFLARRILAEYPEARSFDLENVLREFERSITSELDFNVEADNMRKFQANFQDDPRVRIPKVYPSLCARKVLCMAFLKGVRMRDARALGSDMAVVGDRYLTVAYDMLFVHGLFHGDLHPGNVLVLEDDVIGLLDFGMVGRLSKEMRNNVVSIMFALQRGDFRTIARLFYEIAIKDERVDYKRIESDTIEVMDKHWSTGASVKDMALGPFVMELAARAGHHGARVPAAYTMFFKAIVTSEGLAKTLIDEVDPISAIKPYFEKMITEQLSKENLQSEAFYLALTLSSLLNRLPVTVSQILDDVDAQRLQITVNQKADPLIISAANHRVNQGICAALAITCLICGTLVLLTPQAWVVGVPVLSLGFYGGAAVFAVLTFWMAVRPDWFP